MVASIRIGIEGKLYRNWLRMDTTHKYIHTISITCKLWLR